jgi:hypothetical protein
MEVYQRDIRIKNKVESFIINDNNYLRKNCNKNKLKFSKFSFFFLKHVFKEVFLPVGYPNSVRNEYLVYQLYDSIQGMSSYLRSVLVTKAVLQNYGVGSNEASPLSAALVWVLKDGIGSFGSLIFAYYYVESFEVYVKEWRLSADVLNNIGLTLDLITPLFPSNWFIYITSVSALSKALCGLIAGATRTRISAHFAIKGHLADVTAKESTQETAIYLIGLVLGMILAKFIGKDDNSTYILFFLLLCIHQLSNYMLVRTLNIDTLNPQKCYLIVKNLNDNNDNIILTPLDISKKESLFFPFWYRYNGVKLGCSIEELLISINWMKKYNDNYFNDIFNNNNNNNNKMNSSNLLTELVKIWTGNNFIIAIDKDSRVMVCLKENCIEFDILKGFFISIYLSQRWNQDKYKLNNIHDNVINKYKSLIMESKLALEWFEKSIMNNNNNNNNTNSPLKELLQGLINSNWDIGEYKTKLIDGNWRYSLEDLRTL